MNKTININLAGRLITINEDAFEILQQYLNSLKSHFNKEEGGEEILHDMEDRVSELFEMKMKKGKVSIDVNDVNEIIAIMGRPEELMDESDSASNEHKEKNSKQDPLIDFGKKLRKSKSEKIIGGVCGGMAHYFNIDPTIIRFIFAFITLLWGTGLLIYVILWAILPYEDEKPVLKLKKRLYRNTENKVLGGVCSGLAAYFNIDIIWMRLLFLAPFILSVSAGYFDFHLFKISLGGAPSLSLLYIILWVILPEAKTLTEKMEIQGEKLDVHNISNAMKQQESQQSEEKMPKKSVFWKLIKVVFLVALAVVIFPVFIVSIILLFVFFTILLSYLFKIPQLSGMGLDASSFASLITDNPMHQTGLIISMFCIAFLLLWFIITGFYRLLSGNKKKIAPWLRISAIWLLIVSVFYLFWLGGNVADDFKVKHFKKETFHLQDFSSDTFIISQKLSDSLEKEGYIKLYDLKESSSFKINENNELEFKGVSLNIVPSKDSFFHVELEKTAYGSNEKRAKEALQNMQVTIQQQGSMLYVNPNLTLKANAPFRGQHVVVNIEIPENKVFEPKDVSIYSWMTREYNIGKGNVQIKKSYFPIYQNNNFYKVSNHEIVNMSNNEAE